MPRTTPRVADSQVIGQSSGVEKPRGARKGSSGFFCVLSARPGEVNWATTALTSGGKALTQDERRRLLRARLRAALTSLRQAPDSHYWREVGKQKIAALVSQIRALR